MSFDPNDFNDQADFLGALQRQKLIELQKEQNEALKKKQHTDSRLRTSTKSKACPWCGGELPGEYVKCMHCSSAISWFSGYPCKPGEESLIKNIINAAEYRRHQLEEHKMIEAIIVHCKSCGTRIPQCSKNFKVETCVECNYKAGLGSKVSPEEAEKVRKNSGCLSTIGILLLFFFYLRYQ